MHDESHPSEGSERRDFGRDGKLACIRDEGTDWTVFEYSLDGERIGGPTPAGERAGN